VWASFKRYIFGELNGRTKGATLQGAWGIAAACRRISAVQERKARPVGARPIFFFDFYFINRYYFLTLYIEIRYFLNYKQKKIN